MTAARRAKVLAVDDRRENLVALQAILEGLSVEVVAVGGGEDALKQLLVDDFAVILLDAHMPGMDGFETAAHIKRRERTRHVPILFLTAVDYDPHLAFRGYQAGAVDYISKPFDPWVLRSKVSVFVDLWAVQSQLAARAAEHDALGSAVDDVLDLLGTSGTPMPDPGAVAGPHPHAAGRRPGRARLTAACRPTRRGERRTGVVPRPGLILPRSACSAVPSALWVGAQSRFDASTVSTAWMTCRRRAARSASSAGPSASGTTSVITCSRTAGPCGAQQRDVSAESRSRSQAWPVPRGTRPIWAHAHRRARCGGTPRRARSAAPSSV